MAIAIIAKILAGILQIYKYLLIIRIILSWFPQILFSPNPLVMALIHLTDPPMYYMRRWLPFLQIGFFDFSPIVLFIIVDYVSAFCLQIAFRYSFY